MADPMKIRATAQGDIVEVRVLMAHEMETGTRKDAAGKTIPAHFIQTVDATYNGKVVFAAQWGPAIAKNPSCSSSSRAARKATRSDQLDRQQG